jgi:D-beta-D-heptose 7-phosphate kinase/D-beta-D-heptose 1-phosphate adenosyltransferase
VVGDLMLDHYVWGDVHRISPEAPVPVIHAVRDSWAAGGAANVARNLAEIGVATRVVGRVGNDEAGQRLCQILSENNIRLIEGAAACDQTPTIVKTRVIARTQQVCRIDRESTRDRYRVDHFDSLMRDLDQAFAESDAVILSDYAKGVVTQALLDRILVRRHGNRPFVAVDPKPSHALAPRGVNLLTPNRLEALQLAGLPSPHTAEDYPLEEICHRVHDLYEPETLVVTLGGQGMAVSRNGKIDTVLPTLAREVFDVSGAGDAVIATLTAALVAGAEPVQAAQLANAAAGCVVGHIGTVPVNRNELIALLRTQTVRG